MNTGEAYSIEITGLTAEGAGVGRIKGEAVFVPGAIPGERCLVRITHLGRSNAFAVLEEIQRPSAHRITPDCPYDARCGGCAFRHMDYALEAELKRQRVLDCLQRIGRQTPRALPMHPAPVTEGYRNKIVFPVQPGGKHAVAGFYQAGTHRVTSIAHCRLQPDCADRVRNAVLAWMEQEKIPAYDEKNRRGLIRHICLRSAQETGELLVCVTANCRSLPRADALVRMLRAAAPEITTIVFSPNEKPGNTILGADFIPLYGSGSIEDVLCGLRFRLSAPAFYQVNHDQAERLYAKALEFAALSGRELVLDLYCGTGTITLCLAQRAKKAVGVELVPQAIEDARANAARNGLTNTEFFCMDAGAAANMLAAQALRPDVIVVDPPRKGLSADVIDAIAQMAPPRLVYVSCDPATLARDVQLLSQRGYRLEAAEAFDLFPRCAHVETVVLLSKGEVDSKKIRVEFSLEDMDMSEFQDGATYPQIKDYVLEHSGLKVSNLYISQIKRKCGIEVGKNYNLPKSEDSRQPQCPPEKEKAIREAFKYFGMI